MIEFIRERDLERHLDGDAGKRIIRRALHLTSFTQEEWAGCDDLAELMSCTHTSFEEDNLMERFVRRGIEGVLSYVKVLDEEWEQFPVRIAIFRSRQELEGHLNDILAQEVMES